MREIKNISIAGAGTMGASMAEAFAKFEYSVILYDLFPSALEKAKKLIAINHGTEVEHGVMTEQESKEILSRIIYTSDIRDLANTHFMVEAILEDMEIKHKFWKDASEIVPHDAVLASNTSGLSITKIAEAVKNPERFAGMHWINPPHIIPLIEVISGEKTAKETAEAIFHVAITLGKKPAYVNDAPGFVLNRIQFAIMRECLNIVERGIASPESIDDVMKYALGFRYACLGPFEVADLGGLDIFYNIASYLFKDLSNANAPFSLLKDAYENKKLGVKNGEGFYDYSDGRDVATIKYRDQMFTKLAKCMYGKE